MCFHIYIAHNLGYTFKAAFGQLLLMHTCIRIGRIVGRAARRTCDLSRPNLCSSSSSSSSAAAKQFAGLARPLVHNRFECLINLSSLRLLISAAIRDLSGAHCRYNAPRQFPPRLGRTSPKLVLLVAGEGCDSLPLFSFRATRVRRPLLERSWLRYGLSFEYALVSHCGKKERGFSFLK